MPDNESAYNFRDYIREIPDFPKPGIRFYDIAPLLGNGAVFAAAVDAMAAPLKDRVSKVAAFDARGFLFGGALAVSLGVGCVMLRKPGKLPGDIEAVSYDLEYGTNALELQTGMISPEDTVVLVDDVIATGGTALAGIELVRKCGAGVTEFCALIDLPELGGSAQILQEGVPVRALLRIDGSAA